MNVPYCMMQIFRMKYSRGIRSLKIEISRISHMIPEKRMPVSLLFVLWVPIRTDIRTQIKHIKTDAVAFLHNIRWTCPQMQQ